MSTRQSRRGERPKDAISYSEMSPSKFFYEYKGVAGFDNPSKALYQTVRELVENALDATEHHGILPYIKVEIKREEEGEDYYTVVVEDNGIGVDPKHVPDAFGKVLVSSKYRLLQTRGRFGLGAKMAILYGQVTTGKPVVIHTSPRYSKRIYFFKLKINIDKNEPIILEKGIYPNTTDWHGLRIAVTIKGDWSHAKSRIYEYMMRTAIIAPYATIVFVDPSGNIIRYQRTIRKLPPPPIEVKPHPRGVDIELLKQLIRRTQASTMLELLTKAFQRVGKKTAMKFLEYAKIDPQTDPRTLSDTELARLAQKMREYEGFLPPSSDALSPIGEEIIKTGLKTILKPEFVTAVTRKPQTYEGHPFIVEVGIAYGGEIEPRKEPLLLRYANKIPLLYDEKSDVAWKVVNPDNFDWKNYMVTFPAPLAVLVHIASTKVPYKGLGKESVAIVPEIEKEIANAVKEAARKLRSYLLMKKREEEAKKRVSTFLRYIPEVTRSLSSIFHLNSDSEKELERKLMQIMLNKINLDDPKIKEYIEKTEIVIEE